MRSLLAFCSLIALMSQAYARDLAVLPADAHKNWQAVGRINVAGYRKREMCSGTLISPTRVLTAAHCLAGVDGVGPKPEDFTFVAGWLRGEAADSVTGADIWVHPNAYAQGTLDIRFDIAILTLERASTVTPLRVTNGTMASPFGILGYSTRRPHMLGASFSCDGELVSDLLRLDCPVRPGNSGGPVVVYADNAWKVAAVISAMGQTGALAVPTTRLQSP